MNLSNQLIPAAGFFGCTPNLTLEIALARKITGIRLSLNGGHGQILNIKDVQATKDGGLINLLKLNPTCQQSSFHHSNSKKDAATLLQGMGLHTGDGDFAWWEATFEDCFEVSKLSILNRPDGWGCRSRNLAVQVRGANLRWETVHEVSSPQSFAETILAASAITGVISFIETDTPQQARQRIVNAIACTILNKQNSLQNIPWKKIIPLVPIWNPEPLTDSEIIIVAGMLLAQSLQHDYMTMTLLSLNLTSSRQIQRMQAAINQIAQSKALGPWVITRHGVQRSLLLAKKADYLASAHEVIDHLKKLGLQTVLGYGTLLGAVRSGEFIAHDDDVDIIFKIDATDFSSALKKIKEIEADFSSAGFSVTSMMPHGLNMHVRAPGKSVNIDIFPTWSVGTRLFLHMEKMRVRDIDANLIFPPTTLKLHGENFPAPAKPEDFLKERYGEEWRNPDPFFEWPWQLAESA